MNRQIAILANGCFWCTEAVFSSLKGVYKVTPGFTGGHVKNPAYREVVMGGTGHAEAIRIEFNEDEILFSELLYIFFTTHDPTTLNRQGYDVGEQYRSAIFYQSDLQKKIANEVIEELNRPDYFDGQIVTQVQPAAHFYEAEQEHHDFYENNPNFRYCELIIDPKIKKLKDNFPDKLKDKMQPKL
ncbi:MAG: peptide-methionine (S)-S-oxide reductase MsrA [Psychroflexus sp.]|nr:peptide-methionine (S)-S-oxide reductase MsrA [Psychroflexus sp.]MDR9448125.1 peptide-methionine (S)-S-oxide reductase MsrA [Psychroflexus sp.]